MRSPRLQGQGGRAPHNAPPSHVLLSSECALQHGWTHRAVCYASSLCHPLAPRFLAGPRRAVSAGRVEWASAAGPMQRGRCSSLELARLPAAARSSRSTAPRQAPHLTRLEHATHARPSGATPSSDVSTGRPGGRRSVLTVPAEAACPPGPSQAAAVAAAATTASPRPERTAPAGQR